MHIQKDGGDVEIKITNAKPEDARGTTEVYYRTWLTTYPNEKIGLTVSHIENIFKDSFTEESLFKQADQIAHAPDNVTYLVAKDGEKIIGACRIARSSESAQLKTLYVLPEYQGKGIGRLLWEEARKSCDPRRYHRTRRHL